MPSRRCVWGLFGLALASVLALLLGQPVEQVALVVGGVLLVAALWVLVDLWRSLRQWRQTPVVIQRVLPQAFALGVPKVLSLTLVNNSAHAWYLTVFDEVDEMFAFEGLPQSVTVPAQGQVVIRYTVTPVRRGLARLGVTQLRWRAQGGSLEVHEAQGLAQTLHIYPNFAAVAGYAWLAGDRRLAQIGIKTYAQRGLGTDFRQLTEYQRGQSVRHIDWKATTRRGKPVVREFQDERDQCVFFLLDCGRRLRADEYTAEGSGGSHFDHALNALMLLAYVALREGDEVGAMTFGNPPGQARQFAPRKGHAALNGLMNRLHDLQPSTTHSDYLQAAQDLLGVHRKRALVIVITNFRDEDAAELRPALRLLRQKHLVLVASLRERVLRQMTQMPLHQGRDAVTVAAAHLFSQSRQDAFARVLGGDALSIDVEPDQLAVALVNRYHAVKRAGLL